MPKSKRSKGGGDFAKKKRAKLGSGKQISDNATSTAVRSRQVYVPEQRRVAVSLEDDAFEGEPVLEDRRLTLTEILSRMGHPNANVRKDAVWCLRALAKQDQESSRVWAGQAFTKLCLLVDDLDANVRGALRKACEGLVDAVGADAIRPFLDVYEAQIVASLNHVRQEVQVDTLRLVDLLSSAWNEHQLDELLVPVLNMLADPAAYRSPRNGLVVVQSCARILSLTVARRKEGFRERDRGSMECPRVVVHLGEDTDAAPLVLSSYYPPCQVPRSVQVAAQQKTAVNKSDELVIDGLAMALKWWQQHFDALVEGTAAERSNNDTKKIVVCISAIVRDIVHLMSGAHGGEGEASDSKSDAVMKLLSKFTKAVGNRRPPKDVHNVIESNFREARLCVGTGGNLSE